MAKQVVNYSIFLASPSDLDSERDQMKIIIEELNLSYGNSNNINLELLKWETHSAPAITNTYTQDVINKDIGEDYDLFIGILWKKFGTQTAQFKSGTEEEFQRAVKRFKNGENIQILIYFKTEPVNIYDIDLEQLTKIKEFKASLGDLGVYYFSFSNEVEFNSHLRTHIPKRISDLEKINKSQELIDKIGSITEDILPLAPSDEDLGLFDYMIDFESSLWSSTNALNSINTATEEIGRLFNLKTNELNALQLNNAKSVQYVQLFQILSKAVQEYVQKLRIETPNFYDNFEIAITSGLKFINTFSAFEDEIYKQNLEQLLESSLILKNSMPNAIGGMSGFQKIVKNSPKIQSNFNYATRQLDYELADLISELNSAYKLTSEFLSEIELQIQSVNIKLNNI